MYAEKCTIDNNIIQPPCFRATSPPSFALEVFVQCEGESRFRRLCQPFLYSHSSSNMLDVEVCGN